MNINMLIPRVEQGKPGMLPFKFKWRRAHHAAYWFDLKIAQDKGLVFWQTISNAMLLQEFKPGACMVKAVRKNTDDTEAEILYQWRAHELREAPRIVLAQSAFVGDRSREPHTKKPQSGQCPESMKELMVYHKQSMKRSSS